jgi:hypothetical protein
MHPLVLILLILLAIICLLHLTRFVWRAVGAAMRVGWKVRCVSVRVVGTCVCMFWVVVLVGVVVWGLVAAVAG